MDCVIRVLSGPDAGESARLQPGVNLIGRSPKAALRLKASDISWEHCSITRSGDEYIAENLSALGTYIDDAKLSSPVKLRPRDQLRLSKDTLLRFEVMGDDVGLLAGRRGIVLALVVLLLGAITWFCWDAMTPVKAADDWTSAYNVLEPWVAEEAAARRLPPDTAVLFRDAWRLEQAEDYRNSSALWLRLQLAVDSVEERGGLQKASAENPGALQQLLTPPAAKNNGASQALDEQRPAAFAQFVKRRLDWSTRQAKNQGANQ